MQSGCSEGVGIVVAANNKRLQTIRKILGFLHQRKMQCEVDLSIM